LASNAAASPVEVSGDGAVAPSAGTAICTSWRTSSGSTRVTGSVHVTAPHSSPAGSPSIVSRTPSASAPAASVAVHTSCWIIVAAPSDPMDAVRACSLRSTVIVPSDRVTPSTSVPGSHAVE
jgi:hypothetical protein